MTIMVTTLMGTTTTPMQRLAMTPTRRPPLGRMTAMMRRRP